MRPSTWPSSPNPQPLFPLSDSPCPSILGDEIHKFGVRTVKKNRCAALVKTAPGGLSGIEVGQRSEH